MQRYDFDELTKHECDDGEWVKASEAEAEIAAKDARIAELESLLKESTEDGSRCNRRCTGGEMSKFKATVLVDLLYDNLCYRCPFYDYMGGNFHECSATNTDFDTRWEAEDCHRPSWCPLQKVEVKE